MPDAKNRSRDHRGHFQRSNQEIEHDARAAELRGQGMTYAAIARELGVSTPNAWHAVRRAFRDTLMEPADQARSVELARLEALHDKAMAVLERDHITVSHGRIIEGPDGTPLLDDGPRIQAINTLLRVSESRRKLLGIDAPQSLEVGISDLDRQIADTERRLAAAAGAPGEATPPQGTES